MLLAVIAVIAVSLEGFIFRALIKRRNLARSMHITIDERCLRKAEDAICLLGEKVTDCLIGKVVRGARSASILTSQRIPEKLLDPPVERNYAIDAGGGFYIFTINIELLIDCLIREEDRWRKNKDSLAATQRDSMLGTDLGL